MAKSSSPAPGTAQPSRWRRGIYEWVMRGASPAGAPNDQGLTTPEEEQLVALGGSERRLRSWSLLLLSILLYACAYIAEHSALEVRDRHFIKDGFFTIATAVIVSFLFSRLLDIPETVNRITVRLGDVLFQDRYLRMIRPTLPELRKKIDRIYHGEIDDNRGLYDFVNREIAKYYSSCYRRSYTLNIRCAQEGPHLLWSETVSYDFVRNTDDKDAAPEIYVHRFDDVDASQMGVPADGAEDQLYLAAIRDITLRVEAPGFGVLEYRMDQQAKKELRKVAYQNQPPGVTGAEDKVGVGCTRVGDRFSFWYKFEFPAALAQTKEVTVTLTAKWLRRFQDDLYYFTAQKPIQDLTMYCYFEPAVRLEMFRYRAKRFYEEPPTIPDTDKHVGRLPPTGWVLPGHGVCVAWFGLQPTAPGAVFEETKST